jgi:hypothetical protein
MKALKLFAVILIAGQIAGCSAYKAARQTKKDDKLYKNATTNPRVAPRVAYDYNMLHPIDQKTILIKGKDSIVIDSIPYDRVRDSIIFSECPTLNLDSLKRALTRTITKIRTDTLLIPDTSTLRRLGSVQANYTNLQGKYEQQTAQVSETKKDLSKWKLWSIVSGAFLLLVIGFLIYLLLK